MHLPRLLSEAAPSHPSLGSSIPSRACVVWSSLIARPGLCVSRLCSCCAFALETFVQTQGPLGPSRQHFFFWEVLVVIVVVSHVQHAMVGRSLGHSLSFSRPLLPARALVSCCCLFALPLHLDSDAGVLGEAPSDGGGGHACQCHSRESFPFLWLFCSHSIWHMLAFCFYAYV